MDYNIFERSGERTFRGAALRAVERDLAWGDKGLLRQFGSISAGFGIVANTYNHEGINRTGVFIGNYRLSGQEGPRWLGNGRLHETFRGAAGITPEHSAWQKTKRGISAAAPMRSLLPVVGTAIHAGLEFNNARNQGEGVFRSAGMAGVEVAKFALMMKAGGMILTNPYLTAGLGVAAVGAIGAYAALSSIDQGNQYLQHRLQQNSTVPSMSMHTQQAATSRQRAIRSISQSSVNVLRALGNESTYFHTPKAAYGNIMNPGHVQPFWSPAQAGIY